MDKQIKKVKRAVTRGNKKEAITSIDKLLRMDKKYDKRLSKCDRVMGKRVS